MAAFEHDLQAFLRRPRESLNIELKQWIAPATPEGKAKIAKACIALRNNDGGKLIIGFKDDGTPDAANAPADVANTFHPDVIQAIVSNYSTELFAVDVAFVDVDGQSYPAITVPSGVRTPVAAKADLAGSDGRPLIKDHTVYVRSLTSNGVFSSSEARRGDWDRLTRLCFTNREADIGSFVRCHLAALNPESLAALVPALTNLLRRPTNADQVLEELTRGRHRFEEACRRRKMPLPKYGCRSNTPNSVSYSSIRLKRGHAR